MARTAWRRAPPHRDAPAALVTAVAVLATVCLPATGGAQGKVELKTEARAEINRVTDEVLDSIRASGA